jgi:hypothetical protein
MLCKNEKIRGKRAKWVDQKEINRRKEKRHCFRYSRNKYRVKHYPLKPPHRLKALKQEVIKGQRSKPKERAATEDIAYSSANKSTPN